MLVSHFSRVRTALRDREVLTASLRELGYEVTEGGTIRSRVGVREIDLSISTKNGNGIGFVKDGDGCYNLVADWWGMGRKDRQILDRRAGTRARVQRTYAERMIREQTEKEGFSLVERSEEEDGSIRIMVRRWT
jgi:hypothetical protein